MCKLAVGEALLGNPEEVLCQLSPGLITSVAKKGTGMSKWSLNVNLETMTGSLTENVWAGHVEIY